MRAHLAPGVLQIAADGTDGSVVWDQIGITSEDALVESPMFSAARPAGFEPATCGFEGRRQTQWTPRTYPLCDPNLILFNEAVELLRLAKDGKGVDAGRAERFARGVLEGTEVGRVAMAVLDGGLFAGAKLVELAEAIVGEAAAVASGRSSRGSG